MTLPSGTVIVLGVEKISLISYLFYKCMEFLTVQLRLQIVSEVSEVLDDTMKTTHLSYCKNQTGHC